MDTVTDRTAELERYTARLHERIRSLESQLDTIGKGMSALAKTVTSWQDEAPDLEMPAGLHRLERPELFEVGPEGEVGDIFWKIECACGWTSDRRGMCEGVELLGAKHLAEAVAS